MSVELCWTECPFFRYQLLETPGEGEVLRFYCKFFLEGKEPMVSLDNSDQIEVVLAKFKEFEVVFDDVPCIAPVVWRGW